MWRNNYSGYELQIADAAATQANNKEHRSALETVQILIAHEDGAKKLSAMVKKAECQIELGENYITTCEEIASALKQFNLQNQPTTTLHDELHDKIELLAERVVKINVNCSLLLLRCKLDMIMGFFQGETRLVKLGRIGKTMQRIAAEMQEQNKGIHFKAQYPLMDVVLKEMQRINDIELKAKCKSVAWFLKYYGFCCIYAADYDKSIEINKQAIILMETAYGDEANHHRVLGLCCGNLANAYDNLNKLGEAKQCYETAIKIYNQAKDWVDDKQKVDNMLRATSFLQDVETKLKEMLLNDL